MNYSELKKIDLANGGRCGSSTIKDTMASQAQINEEKWQKNGAEIMRIARKYNMKVLDLLQAFDELKALLRVFDEKQNELDCTHGDAVKWNPYNEVVQCHKCGQVFVSATELDAVRKEAFEAGYRKAIESENLIPAIQKEIVQELARAKADERREILELIDAKVIALQNKSSETAFWTSKSLADLRKAIEKMGEK